MTLHHSLVVIAGLDPAIQGHRTGPAVVDARWREFRAANMDRRVKPGDDIRVARSDRNPL
jgi:hypothetical protein